MGNDTRKSRVNNAPNTKTTTKCPKILDKLRLGEKKKTAGYRFNRHANFVTSAGE